MFSKFLYALIITAIVIFATLSLSRAADRAKKAEEELKGKLADEQGKGLLGRLKE